jgi:hypothetical protein
VETFSLLPTLTASQSLNYFVFSMNFLEQKPLMSITYGKNFKAKKIIYQHVYLWEKWGENHFINATNFDTLPTVEKLSIYHEMFGTA